MPRYMANALKFLMIILAPIAVIAISISRRTISGDQYVAALEILGTRTQSGAIEFFGADINTVAALLDFLDHWSLSILLVTLLLGIVGLLLSKNRLRAAWQICLGLFFTFGFWAIFLTRSRQAIADYLGASISDLSALVIAAFLVDLSDELLNLTGVLALCFGILAIALWLLGGRRKSNS